MKDNKKIIKKAPLFIALLFLCNPNITVIDPLPDFIGYMLLCVALYRLSDLNESIGGACTAFKRMIFIDAGKWLAIFWIFGMSVTSERSSSILLWTFVFAVVEMICLFPAYINLFEGFTQIGYRYSSAAIFGKGGKTSKTDKLKILTLIFIGLKAVLCVLPEFADLTNSIYSESVGGIMTLYRYIGIMRVLGMLPIAVCGIIWLISMFSYFNAVMKDEELCGALCQKYETDVASKRGIFVRRNFKTVTLLALISFVLTIDVRIDSQNVVPDFLAAIFFIILFAFVERYNSKKTKRWIVSTSFYTVISVVSFAVEFYFFEKYNYFAIIRDDMAMKVFYIMIAVNIIKAICFVWMLFDLYKVLSNAISEHTGYVIGMERVGDSEKRMIDTFHADLRRTVIYAIVGGILYIITDVCYDIFAPELGFMGLVNLIFAGICIFLFGKAFSAIETAIDTKYMLE